MSKPLHLGRSGCAAFVLATMLQTIGCDVAGSCDKTIMGMRYSVELWSVGIDGSDRRMEHVLEPRSWGVIGPRGLSFHLVAAPQGQDRVYYRRVDPDQQRTGLYYLNLATRTEQRVQTVSTAHSFAASPDALHALYVSSSTDRSTELRLLDLVSLEDQLLLSDSFNIQFPRWLGNDAGIYYYRRDPSNIYFKSAPGEGTWIAHQDSTKLVWPGLPGIVTPDGSSILYTLDTNPDITRAHYAIFINKSGDTSATRLADGVLQAVASDGTYIMYTIPHEYPSAELWIMNIDGSEKHRVTSALNHIGDLSQTVDGHKLIFVSLEGIWAVNSDGSDLKQIIATPTHPNGHIENSLLAPLGDRFYYVVGITEYDKC